jgi:hypothetical protein
MLLRHALAKPNARSSHRIAGRRNRCNRGDLAGRGRRDRRVRPERRAFPFGSFRRHRREHHPTILLLNLASRATQFSVSLVRIIWRLSDFIGPYIDNRIAIDILDTEHDALRWTADDARQIIALRKKMMSFPGKAFAHASPARHTSISMPSAISWNAASQSSSSSDASQPASKRPLETTAPSALSQPSSYG